jgi:hypothetical protein
MKITLDNKTLDALDMKSIEPKITTYHDYFTLPSGQEHYRLLRYLAKVIDGTVIEIGTHAATSVVAMSADTTHPIVTYDIVNEKHREFEDLPTVTFRLCEFSDDVEYRDTILSAPMIFIDAPHDGAFEMFCYQWLKDNKYKGLTIWDDIHLNEPMRQFWSRVNLPKLDLSKYGHITGTGAIFFGDNVEFELK